MIFFSLPAKIFLLAMLAPLDTFLHVCRLAVFTHSTHSQCVTADVQAVKGQDLGTAWPVLKATRTKRAPVQVHVEF